MAFQLDGTKIQLASNGSSWIHEASDANPFLPASYKQYSHFALEDVSLSQKGNVTAGGYSEYVLDTQADILLNLFFRVGVGSAPSEYPWLAETLVDEIKIYSGETLIDYYTNTYQRAYYNFLLNADKKSTWDKLTSSTGQPSGDLYLPLIFGFCQNDDQTLPHVAMINKNIRIEVKWGADLSNLNTSDITLFGKVAFLQGTELNNVKFTNEYVLLKTVDTKKTTIDTETATQLSRDMFLKRLVRDVFWAIDKKPPITDSTFTWRDFGFNWPIPLVLNSSVITDIMTPIPAITAHTQPHLSSGVVRMVTGLNLTGGKMETGKFILDKKTLFPLQKEKFFNIMQSYWRYSGCPQPGYYAYSWSLYPEQTQPSGSLNTSLFNEIQLDMSLYEASPNLSMTWYSSMSTITKKANGALIPISKD